jgi:nucleotide-binding universal stress UspA family protein
MTAKTNEPAPDLQVRHVLVPVDGSEFSLQALPTARVLAERLDAELQTVSVAGADDDADRLRALAAATLGVDAGDGRVHVVSEVDPAEAIARRAAELEACVVCLTSHGRGRLQGAVVGSVARSVFQRSTKPMVALGPMADNPGWSPRPRRWSEPLSVLRMVACVDGSDTSEQVLPLAASWARALDMSLTILTVVEDAPDPIRPGEKRTRYGAGVAPASYIESLVQRWTGIVQSVDGEVVRDPISAAGGIRTHLGQRPAGLVAVTTHARSGLQRALLGAQAASIVHASVAPCLVAPVQA